ncbi:hypothetical protein DPQ22_03440 [Candidatus Tokpelaia sp.]|nr:hypothetical protein DPQ22_03440 [Candidatus Tokpelaia sp.]
MFDRPDKLKTGAQGAAQAGSACPLAKAAISKAFFPAVKGRLIKKTLLQPAGRMICRVRNCRTIKYII